MSSNRFSDQSHPQRNANANASANLKRRSDDRSRVEGFHGYPQQKRARTQTQIPSAAFSPKVPVYHGSNKARVPHSYDPNSYVHGLRSDVCNYIPPNHLSHVLRNNDASVSVSLSVSASPQPMTPSGFGTCNPHRASNLLPRKMGTDVSFDSLPEWNPNEFVSQNRNGFVPSVRSPNFIPHGSSDNLRWIGNENQRYASTVSNGVNTAPQMCGVDAYLNNYPRATAAKLPYPMPANHERPVSIPPQVMPNRKQPLVSKDLSALLSELKKRGLVSPNDVLNQTSEIDENRDDRGLGTEFDLSLLRVRHESVINALYSDLPRQCSACGLRFRCQEEHRGHMDWHVRKNRMAKNTNKNARQTQKPDKSRKWFASAGLWLTAGTTEPLNDEVVAELFNADKESQKKEDKEFVVPADDDQRMCALCKEPFEDFFSDEADEWMYKGAVYLNMHEKQTETRTGVNIKMLGPIVHAKCMPENRKASTQDTRQQKLIPVPFLSARALVC